LFDDLCIVKIEALRRNPFRKA